MAKNEILFVYCLLGLFHVDVDAVRITSLDVPKTAWDTVTLNCRYDLEGDQLYAVKWYKDGKEFFRCIADGTVQEFPLNDIKIYHGGTSQIGSCYFELTVLTEKSAGQYTCEVSLDWPTFKTVYQTGNLRIFEPSKIVQQQTTPSSDTPHIPTSIRNSAPVPIDYLQISIFVLFITISSMISILIN